MIVLGVLLGGAGAVIGLIAYGVWYLLTLPKKPKQNYSCYTESEKDRLLKEKDKEIERLRMEKYIPNHNVDTDISREISKGVRDGIARSQIEHGEDIGNYGLSDIWFR